MPGTQKKTIILIDISEENYSFAELYHTIIARVIGCRCPNCGEVGWYRRHAWYEKYHYTQLIKIVRIKCRSCGTTHAVIPSFSLPGTSVGTEEVEEYLENRHNGLGRGKSARIFLGLGLHEEYPKSLDKMFTAAVYRAQVLLPEEGDVTVRGYAWVRSCFSTDIQRPLWEMNILCGNRGYNPVFFSRASILMYPKRKSGIRISHNMPSATTGRMEINSS